MCRLPVLLVLICVAGIFLKPALAEEQESMVVPDHPVPAKLTLPGNAARGPGKDVPWWRQQKIVFMWGHWWPSRRSDDGRDLSKRNHDKALPRHVFDNLSQAGATVYVEGWGFDPTNARLARQFGLKCFASVFSYDLSARMGDAELSRTFGLVHAPNPRRAVTRTGELSDKKKAWCPLDEDLYGKWMVEPFIPGLREGIIDGLHYDWEPYGGHDEADICYCDDCFAEFLRRRGIREDLPAPAERHRRLERGALVRAYEQNFIARREEMFAGLVGKLRAINPELLFSSYRSYRWEFMKAVHAPETPFIVLARRHYHTDDRQAWWESYSAWMKERGYLCIAGGHMHALFGGQTSQVSAARWIYEASINEDGVWLWFQRPLDDEILRAYAVADSQIKAVEHAVGRFMLRGREDRNFVTPVEWTGRLALEQAVVVRTYHMGDEHLVHANNVNTEWPLRVHLRLPRLEKGRRWTAKDPMTGLYYSLDGKSARWTTAALRAGVSVAMEPRSDLFILIAPADEPVEVDPTGLVRSRQFDALPGHALGSKWAGAVKAIPPPIRRMHNSIYGDKLKAVLASAEKVADLPHKGWLFSRDPGDRGERDKWYRPDYTMDGWTPIEIGSFWGDKARTGAGWYRGDVEVPPLPEGKRVYLHFGAVDEDLVLWIDGKYTGDYFHPRGPGYAWDKPFAIDVTGKLTGGKHHLAMRVRNVAAAGGVWKPVSVLVGPGTGAVVTPVEDAPGVADRDGTLVYTVTESMGFQGDDAPLTIANAIRTIDIRTVNQVRLRQLRGHLWSPTFSPDGRRIAFVHDVGGRGQVCVMNADGSEVVNISNNTLCDRFPVWSPDGGRIAFVSDRSGDWDIHVMNADGTGQRRIAGNPGMDRAPAWSPDGGRLAWESHVSGVPTVWLCDADGRNSRPLIARGESPVVEIHDRTLLIPDTFYLTDPVWSPDGTRIAAPMLHHHIGYRVIVVQVDGTRLTEVSRSKGPPIVGWSPDGTQLAVAGWVHAQYPEPELTFIYLANTDYVPKDPRFTRTMSHGDIPLLEIQSPPGPRQVYANELPAQGDVLDRRTWYSHGSSLPRRVLKRVYSLAWSPDGESLAFSSDMDPSGAFHVYIVNREGGKPVQLDGSASAWPQQVSWQPR